jgi:hypothetical protein
MRRTRKRERGKMRRGGYIGRAGAKRGNLKFGKADGERTNRRERRGWEVHVQ